tara:strand:- start:17521 stop:17691 length:171 start_codon:yes stop_codon:yes gene_type:complete
MLDCLDDILDLVQDLPAEDLRGIDKKQLIMLMEIVYDKKCDIDKEILLNKRRKNGR